MDTQQKAKRIAHISIRNIVLNMILTLCKVIGGLLSGSLAVLTDGLNSLFDVATTVTVLVCSRFTKEPSDQEHQYGHEKIESVVSLVIALFLGASALYTMYESIARVAQNRQVTLSYFALFATALSAIVKWFMYRSTQKEAQALASDNLKLVAMDYRSDVLLSASVFLGVLLAMLGIRYLEPIAAIVACLILLKGAWGFLVTSFRQLTDTATDSLTHQILFDAASSCPGVEGIDLLRTRMHGNAYYVDIEIGVDPTLTVYQGHLIAQHVHDKLEGELECKIKHCMVHVNPAQR